MKRAEALRRLHAALPELRREFGATRVGVFGSVARDEARADSDVDILVEFDVAPTFGGFEALKERLEAVMGRPVDVATPDGLHRLVRGRALAESIYADA
jgi:predicted nucleotidyltransferase